MKKHKSHDEEEQEEKKDWNRNGTYRGLIRNCYKYMHDDCDDVQSMYDYYYNIDTGVVQNADKCEDVCEEYLTVKRMWEW